MVVFALCNDCHTAGWLPAGDVPADQWLLGSPVGYEGPWEKDARALYRYARNSGPGGQHMPTPIPPGAPLTEPYTTLRVWPAGTVLEPTMPDAAQ
jgi:hypothetical protein